MALERVLGFLSTKRCGLEYWNICGSGTVVVPRSRKRLTEPVGKRNRSRLRIDCCRPYALAMLVVPNLQTIRAAHERIRPFVHRTPVMTCGTIDALSGATIFFKCENLQKVGAFKYRGATNAVQSLSDADAARGVVTHSSGNHAAALALAAKVRGIAAHIVMPTTTPQIKQDAVAGYGGQITLCQPTLAARETTAAAIQQRTGATMIHPFDNDAVIAGQGTAAVELLEDVPELDAILAPVGGGGLLSGTGIAAKALRSNIKVIGCEPALADDAAESLRTGKLVLARPPKSVGDGLLTNLSERTFGHIRMHVDQIALATDEEMLAAMRLVLERMKILIEPSAAVALAVLLNGATNLRGKRVGVIISGGNVELARLAPS